MYAFCSSAVALLALAGLAGCAVPLAPGYDIEREKIEVHYISGAPPHLAVRSEYRLKNVGNSELTSVVATLPGKLLYGMQNLRIEIDGRQVSLPPTLHEGREPSPQEEERIPFDPPWGVKQKRFVVVQYDLNAPSGGEAAAVVDTDYFYLLSSGCFPSFEEPKNLFAHDVRRPVPTDFIVRVPDAFRVHTAGTLAGTRHNSGETEWHYRIGKRDPELFAVAGMYQEQVVKAPNAEVSFWTFQPMPPEAVNAAGTRLAATLSAYTVAFGPLLKPPLKVWIVRTQSKIDASPWDSGPTLGTAFPDGLVLNEAAFDSGLQRENFLDSAEEGLAHLWVGKRVGIRPEAEFVLRTGFARYAAIAAVEARAGELARRKEILSRLDAYKHAQSEAIEKPLAAVTWNDSAEQRGIVYAKAPLFFIALEDEYGEAALRRSIAHLVSASRGESVGLSDLRAALELETGKNLVEFFRIWLDRPGIPEDFRGRYRQ